jgi:hypothetical protein
LADIIWASWVNLSCHSESSLVGVGQTEVFEDGGPRDEVVTMLAAILVATDETLALRLRPEKFGGLNVLFGALRCLVCLGVPGRPGREGTGAGLAGLASGTADLTHPIFKETTLPVDRGEINDTGLHETNQSNGEMISSSDRISPF